MDIFCQLTYAIQHPNFGVNYDPSNTYLAGEDPIELLKRISHRVVTMHASDRYLINPEIDSGIQIYLDKISKFRKLTTEVEIELLLKVYAGKKSARNKLVKAYLSLVVDIARDYAKFGPPILDLITVGNEGLVGAAADFSPDKADSFGSYAAQCIHQPMKLALAKYEENQNSTLTFTRKLKGGHSIGRRWDSTDQDVPPVNRIAKFLPPQEFHPQEFVGGVFPNNKIPPKKLSQHQLDLLADPATGYSKNLRHGEIGQGLNDYNAIFTELKRVGFDGWISIEDGVDGMDQLVRSVAFLKRKLAQYW